MQLAVPGNPGGSAASIPEEATSQEQQQQSGSLAGSIAGSSSGFGSLPKKRPALFSSELLSGQDIYDPMTLSEIVVPTGGDSNHSDQLGGNQLDSGHTRNSSNTSQLSKGSGYASLNSQSQLSSHPSSSEDGGDHMGNTRLGLGSGLIESGSLDRAKAALERRKKADGDSIGTQTLCRVEVTRPNPDSLIEELIKSTNLEQSSENDDSSGLELFIAKDGKVALGGQEVKNQISAGVFQQVVMKGNNKR